MDTASEIRIEVVAALPGRQDLVTLELPAGATAASAVAASGLDSLYPEIDVKNATLAVWGQVAAPDRELVDGDRVEVLRPLEIDPRDARRELANQGQFMGSVAEKAG